MFDNIYTFYDDAEYHINSLNANKIIKLLKKRISNREETKQNYAFIADAYLMKGDLENALNFALKSKQLDQDYYYADVIIANIYILEVNICKAAKYVENILEKCSEDYYLGYYIAAVFYTFQGNEDKAQEYIDRFMNTSDQNPDFIRLKLELLFIFKDYSNLLKTSFSLLKTFPINIDYFYNAVAMMFVSIFSILFKKIDLPYLFYLLFSSSKDDRYLVLSEKYKADNNLEKSLYYIDKAYEVNPKSCYLIKKAELYSMFDKKDDAIKIYKDILELDPTYIQCYYDLSEIYYFIGDYKQAIEYSNQAILVNYNTEEAFNIKILSLIELENYDKALENIKKFEKDFPNSADLNYHYYSVYKGMNDFNKALVYINKILLLDMHPSFLMCKAILLYYKGIFEDAINTIFKAIELSEKDDGAMYYWLACCYEAKEEYTIALEYINKSILYGEDDLWTFFHKSTILSALGKKAEAKIAYHKAVTLGYKEE